MENRSINIKDIAQLKKENEKLLQIIHFLQVESCEYAFKCNRIENLISNIQAITKDNPTKLVDVSQNMCDIVQATQRRMAPLTPHANLVEKRTSVKSVQVSNQPSTSNKAHIVKPHMVNGHILYIPTINLTRVSDTRSSNESKSKQAENNASPERSATAATDDDMFEAEGEETDNTIQEFTNENQVAHLEEVSEPSTSKSPSHSTVLSGTFQEVKIYLNPMSQEILEEKSRKSTSPRSIKKKPRLRSRRSSARLTKSKRS